MQTNDTIDAKRCNRCKQTLPLASFSNNRAMPDGLEHYCRPCKNEANRTYAANNWAGKREYYKRYYAAHRDDQLAEQKAIRRGLRESALHAYGGDRPACNCCGETIPAFLTIDHVNNDGAAHRRQLGKGQGNLNFLRWLRNNQFPDGFQLLCFNCNIARHHHGGICPHELAAE